jgi:hypothetical protein
MKPHIKTALKWGAIGGISIAILSLILYFISPTAGSESRWRNLLFLPLLFCMVWGTLTVKKNQGDQITFGRAFLVAFLITFTGVLISSVFSVALITWIDPHLGQSIYDKAVEKAREGWEQRGMTDEQMKAAEGYIAYFFKTPVMLGLLIVWQTLIGTIVSLIIAAFAGRKNENAGPISNETSSS